MKRALLMIVGAALIGVGLLAQGQPARPGPELYSQLRWRYIGPEGNRFSAVAGVPGDPLVYYAGSASGGIAKTTDGGVHWQEDLFDDRRSAVDRIARRRAVRSEHRVGRHRRGVDSQPHLGRRRHLQVHRRRQDVDADGPREDRAASAASSSTPPIRTSSWRARSATRTDRSRSAASFARPTAARTGRGRCSWTRTPAARRSRWIRATRASCSPGMWQLEIHTWGRDSGGPGSGLFMSRDGGVTWTKLTGRGLPTKTIGKVMPAIAHSNPKRVYATIETGDGLPCERAADRSRPAVAVRRRRRQLEDGEHGSERDGADRVLRAHGRCHRQRERDLLPQRVLQSSRSTAARRWWRHRGSKRQAAITTTCGSIRPTRTG